MKAALLAVRDLRVSFDRDGASLRAVRGISFDIAAGEAVGIVGESGSGKSVAMLALMRLLPPAARLEAERLALADRDLLTLPDRAMRSARGRDIAMIFQDPLTALNPVLSVGFQIGEVLRRHEGLSRRAAARRAVELLARVGMADPAARARQFPHQFSGGMRQRVMIAIALAGRPKLLIADEPTTALDVTVQAEIVNLVRDIQARDGMAIIWVTHDLALLARLARRVMVMYAGRIVEDAPADALYADPLHPYTVGLLASIPRIDRAARRRRGVMPGAPPDPLALRPGCAFAERCPLADARCRAEEPPFAPFGEDRGVACWYPGTLSLDERQRSLEPSS